VDVPKKFREKIDTQDVNAQFTVYNNIVNDIFDHAMVFIKNVFTLSFLPFW
jgi:hypothetical protein